MKRFFALIGLLVCFSAAADEGMWLPSLIYERIGDMQSKGFKLSAEDIYSVNQASLKDAVVLFGTGCTGELISGEGLLLTNHHCGYSMIQKHSSVEHDYLKDGFWAMTRDEELPNKGLTVKFLERMEDVTSYILNGYDESMTESQRDSLVKVHSQALVSEAVMDGKGLKAQVEALYYGNQYFLFIFREYRDIRLVGAPPSSIGKFGGETDNWMWPRHTGDFSLFRIYADKDNNPADYSEDNVPYTPKKFFRISRTGVYEGDFTFIYGYPGSTQEYVTSDAVRYISEISDPMKIGLRTKRLDIMNKYMGQSQAVRIQYSSKKSSVANSWKKWQGEAKGIEKMNTVEMKKDYEARFTEWAKGTEYEGIVEKLHSLYERLEPYNYSKELFQETAYALEWPSFAAEYLDSPESDRQELKDSFYKDYFEKIDKESFIALMSEFGKLIPEDFIPEYYAAKMNEFGTVEKWADAIYSGSVEDAADFFYGFYDWYVQSIFPVLNVTNSQIKLAYRDYMRGQMEFEKDKTFYPDANLTLRVAYGKVAGYEPSDGVYYKPVSTVQGVMEKDNPDIFDYDIPQSLRDLYAEGGIEDTPVCFLATNHTTGGNSGSPVINADGDLIGINFDRVWEGTQSDVVFDPEICRNISLDIRYLLFIVEKIGGADHLLEEMTFAE